MNCPKCDSKNVIKNDSIHNGKPKFECKDCGRQFIENPTKKVITQDQWDYVDKLLLEKLPIAGISRVTGISEPLVMPCHQALPSQKFLQDRP